MTIEEQDAMWQGTRDAAYGLERCPHCGKLVANVYRHTSQEECEKVNEQIADMIQQGVE